MVARLLRAIFGPSGTVLSSLLYVFLVISSGILLAYLAAYLLIVWLCELFLGRPYV